MVATRFSDQSSLKTVSSDVSHPEVGPLVLFDGVCCLCTAVVQWLIKADPHSRLKFASLQSEAAIHALARAGVNDLANLPDSIVLIDGRGVHAYSSAALRIAGSLRFPHRLVRLALIVPRPLRDAAYRHVARSRYRWFGRHDVCMVPTPHLRRRFLE